jgi:hypothetical protein
MSLVARSNKNKRPSTVCKQSTCSRARRILRQEVVYQVPELGGLATSPRARRSGDESPSSEVWRRVPELGCLATNRRAQRSGDETPSSEVWHRVPELRGLATGSITNSSSLSLLFSLSSLFFVTVRHDDGVRNAAIVFMSQHFNSDPAPVTRRVWVAYQTAPKSESTRLLLDKSCQLPQISRHVPHSSETESALPY